MAYKNPLDERAREARRRHYYANKEQYLARNRKLQQEMKVWVDQVKSAPCMDCGVMYPPYVMDFDHRDPSEKVNHVGVVMRRGSWGALRKEVAKCDVVCSNCHRERTYGNS